MLQNRRSEDEEDDEDQHLISELTSLFHVLVRLKTSNIVGEREEIYEERFYELGVTLLPRLPLLLALRSVRPRKKKKI